MFGVLTHISCSFAEFEKILIEEGIINILLEFLKGVATARERFDPLSPSYFCGLIIKLSANETYRGKLVSGCCVMYIHRFLQDNIQSMRHCICACTALDALATPKKGITTLSLSVQKMGGGNSVVVDRTDPTNDTNIGGIGFLVFMLNARMRDRDMCTQICKTLNYFACTNNEKAKEIVRCNGLRVLVSVLEYDAALPLDDMDSGKLCLSACSLIYGVLSNYKDFKTFKPSDFYRARKIDDRPSNLLKSYINSKSYDYNYDEYNEDNEDEGVEDEDDVDIDDEDDEDEDEYYGYLEDDYSYENYDDFGLLGAENSTLFVRALSNVLNVHINNRDIVLTIVRILSLVLVKLMPSKKKK